MKWFLSILIILNTGCSIMNSGPDMMKDTIAFAQAIGMEGMKDMQATRGTMGVRGAINDPEFWMHFEAGPTWTLNMQMGLRGADISGEMAAAMEQDVEITKEDTELIYRILMNPSLEREQKRNMIMDIIFRAADLINDGTKTGEPVIEKDPVIVGPGSNGVSGGNATGQPSD